MTFRDVMRRDPLTVTADTSVEAARRHIQEGGIHHLPVVDGDRLAGLWVAMDSGEFVRLGPERLHAASPDAAAIDVVGMMLGDDTVVAMSEGKPIGILTRTDVLDLVRKGLVARRAEAHPPLVLRFVGPAGGGKTTLLLKTITGLSRCKVGVIEANPDPPEDRLPARVSGASVAYAPAAHWRKGFREAIEHMRDVDVILVEDRDQPAAASVGLGEDVQIIVVPAADAGTVDVTSLVDAQAIVVTKSEDAVGFDGVSLRAWLRSTNPNLAVFVVGLGDDDRGMRTWQTWLDARLLQHRR